MSVFHSVKIMEILSHRIFFCEINSLGNAIDILNLFSIAGSDLYSAEFHVDSESGLHFDLRGRKSEHKNSL